MNTARRRCLWGLRIFGPCSNVELANHVGMDREDVYRIVYDLRLRGYAAKLGSKSYDVTVDGREWLNKHAPECKSVKALFDTIG